MITIEFTATTLALAMTPAGAALAHVGPGAGGSCGAGMWPTDTGAHPRTGATPAARAGARDGGREVTALGRAASNVIRPSSAKELRRVGASKESAMEKDAARRPQALSAGRTRQATGNSRRAT